MKKFIFLALTMVITLAGISQDHFTRNASEKIVRKATTTNATPLQVDAVSIGTNEVGVITVKVIGVDTSTMATITGVKSYRYPKINGTLTLGTATQDENDASVVDTGVSGATFAAAASSNNVVINVTGKAATTIQWRVITKQSSVKKE